MWLQYRPCIMMNDIMSVSCYLFTTVRVPMLLSIMPFPVLRSMMSKIISKSEQGEWVQGFTGATEPCLCVCRVRVHWRAACPGNFTMRLKTKHFKFLFLRAKGTHGTELSDFRRILLLVTLSLLKTWFSCTLCVCFRRGPVCLPVLPGQFNYQCIERSLQQCVCCHSGMVPWLHLPVVCRTLCRPFVFLRVRPYQRFCMFYYEVQ